MCYFAQITSQLRFQKKKNCTVRAGLLFGVGYIFISPPARERIQAGSQAGGTGRVWLRVECSSQPLVLYCKAAGGQPGGRGGCGCVWVGFSQRAKREQPAGRDL